MTLKYIDDFRDPALARAAVARIHAAWNGPPVRVMEVCGTHTMAIARNGIRSLVSTRVALISGPGCPVCVTPDGYIDAAVALGRRDGIVLATFGDMVKVPGTASSLEKERGNGADVRVVYSPLDAVAIAAEDCRREVVFLGVGFETTAPAIAGAILAARERGLRNFSVLASVRTIPGAMSTLAADPEIRIEGFLCPAHVSAIIGSAAYRPIAERYGIPCVVAGFEPLDILLGLAMVLDQKRTGRAEVENEYSRVVTASGNGKARDVIGRIFERSDAEWRGIGFLPGSGLAIREEYASFDASARFGLPIPAPTAVGACRCGDVLKGKITPDACPLFGTACTPDGPVGPCMVSTEGTCAAHYKYGVQG